MALFPCLLSGVLAAGAFLVFVFTPQTHPEVGQTSIFAIKAETSISLYRNVRMTNVTGHPDRVALWLPHSAGGVISAEESTCCQFIQNGAHWVDRNEPYRIYQAPTRSFVNHVIEAGIHWEEQSGGHRILGAAVESGRIFDDAELERIDVEETNFVARANITYMGDGTLLGVTRLIMDRSLKHIFQWGILVNSAVPAICDAAHNETCYDQKTLFVHELGHVYGLDDLYNAHCALSTIYGYLDTGETRGRQVDAGTRACVTSLYSNMPLVGEQENEAHRQRLLWSVLLHMTFVLFF